MGVRVQAEAPAKRIRDYDEKEGWVHLVYLLISAALIGIGIWTSGLYGEAWTATHPKPNQGVALVVIGAVMAMGYLFSEAWTRAAKYQSQWWADNQTRR